MIGGGGGGEKIPGLGKGEGGGFDFPLCWTGSPLGCNEHSRGGDGVILSPLLLNGRRRPSS